MAANIEVYTTDPCTFCLAAKNLLKKRGLEWTEHLVFGGTPEWDAMMARTGGKSVPQIVIGRRGHRRLPAAPGLRQGRKAERA